MRILVTNDDGITSKGLAVLEKKFSKWGKTTVVAPAFEQSTSGHALSLSSPLRIEQLGKNKYAVNGKPADCTHLALTSIMKQVPTFVVSGINHGANMGQDVYYSGTVAAAREAAVNGVPAFSISLVLDHETAKKQKNGVKHFETAAYAADRVAKQIFKNLGNGDLKKGIKNWPHGLVININVPNVAVKDVAGFRYGSQGRQLYSGPTIQRKDNRGQNYYWIGGIYKGYARKPGTDCVLVGKKYVAVTPLEIDCTDYGFMEEYSQGFS